MRVTVLTAFTIMGCGWLTVASADDRTVALDAEAQAAFQKVAQAPMPDLADATACAQAQAMAASVTTGDSLPNITFEKAYCEMAAAAAADSRSGFDAASETFDAAIADAQAAAARQKIPSSVSPTWSIWAAVARLESGVATDSQERPLTVAVDSEPDTTCQNDAAMANICRSARQLGNAWLGRIALSRGDLTAAQRRFAASGLAEWNRWVSGLQAFGRADYARAAAEEGSAVAGWRDRRPSSLTDRLAPRPDLADALAEWGGAQFAAGDAARAAEALDSAIKSDATNARAYYLRAVVDEKLGHADRAASDYDSASRAALAHSDSAAAHFYRGIVFFRRKELERAENEFASALNGAASAPWAADARAWRFFAAVAGGACGASRDLLQRALESASPFFPKDEAQKAAARCATVARGALWYSLRSYGFP